MSSDVTDRGNTASSDLRQRTEAVAVDPKKIRKRNFLLELYRSAVGKKYVMAITGLVWMGYVFAHMVGNLKLYFGAEGFDRYAEFLRAIAYPILPHEFFLWIMRVLLAVSLVLHVHAAYALTMMNRKARPDGYRSKRHYDAVDFAGRTMRWSGIIVLLFIAFHLADLTFGTANPEYVRGDVYANTVASFQRWPVSLLYIVANLALGLHLYHGGWSLFQSLGVNRPRFNIWRRYFAVAFAAIVTIPNVSFPLAVMTGIIS